MIRVLIASSTGFTIASQTKISAKPEEEIDHQPQAPPQPLK